MSDNQSSDTPAFTPYHSAYYAHELTKRNASDDVRKLGRSLFNATIDLNPHQLDAALFAFKSPLSRGAILADEVGLGKTIEAGLIISQLWAEHKRRILVIAPTILRKQWAQELLDKFFIESMVLDTKVHNAMLASGKRPLEPQNKVVICSYHYASARAKELKATPWDLVVIDEAHRLRNVYKSGNKIAIAIRDAVAEKPKVLLTATPLQNNLLELYGLVSFVDDHLFGSLEAFRARYMRGPIEERQFADLKRRLKPVCQRTLRRQVTEYVRFTNRIPVTQDFTPTEKEHELYVRVSDYLRRDRLVALPNSQRKLITMILWKLLASSTFAIGHTLERLIERVEASAPSEAVKTLQEDFETAGEEEEEWEDEDSADIQPPLPISEDEVNRLDELSELTQSAAIAKAITENSKGKALLTALKHGFDKMEDLGAARKAVIFTESKRTQQYLEGLLNTQGFDGRVLTINGTNSDDRSGAIYKDWVERHKGEPVVTGNKQVDLRAALVEQFRDHADILIATEAASEGVNLQFCSLVVNYDLPWNPQRVEQRIGRCHRYGQQHDVVVINFLNRSNEADVRVYELLDQKFKLFSGVFGSSDEVLGALESGVDFEKRIADIYQTCRTPRDIDAAFTQLKLELEKEIDARMADTRSKLLENFDDEVRQRLRTRKSEAQEELDSLQKLLWNLTRAELGDTATFDEINRSFNLLRPGNDPATAPTGQYQFFNRVREGSPIQAYRTGHPFASDLIERAKNRSLTTAKVVFNYTESKPTIGFVALVDGSEGTSGWLRLTVLTIEALDIEDRLLFAVVNDQGGVVHPDFGSKLFQVPGTIEADDIEVPNDELLEMTTQRLIAASLDEVAQRNTQYFDTETEKLDRWADDLKHGLETELKDLDGQIKQTQKEARLAGSLEDKLELLKKVKGLETDRSKKRRELFDAQDDIDSSKERLISEIEARLDRKDEQRQVLTIRWSIR